MTCGEEAYQPVRSSHGVWVQQEGVLKRRSSSAAQREVRVCTLAAALGMGDVCPGTRWASAEEQAACPGAMVRERFVRAGIPEADRFGALSLSALWLSSMRAAATFGNVLAEPCVGAPLPDERVEALVRGVDDAAFERAVFLCALCRLGDCGGLNVLIEGPEPLRLVLTDFEDSLEDSDSDSGSSSSSGSGSSSGEEPPVSSAFGMEIDDHLTPTEMPYPILAELPAARRPCSTQVRQLIAAARALRPPKQLKEVARSTKRRLERMARALPCSRRELLFAAVPEWGQHFLRAAAAGHKGPLAYEDED